jgi:hypothetical protein
MMPTITLLITLVIMTGCVMYLGSQVKKLHRAIRRHRDQRGDNRCWLDDNELYAILPDFQPPIDTELPPKCIFLHNCERYWATRQGPFTYIELSRLSKEEFMVTCEKYWNEQHGIKIDV